VVSLAALDLEAYNPQNRKEASSDIQLVPIQGQLEQCLTLHVGGPLSSNS
jgi:hypothetical protein